MKKAFSLSEILIALAIMGIMSAILMPAIKNTVPSKKKYLYKAAYKNVEEVLSELINDNGFYPEGNFQNSTDPGYFCNNFASKVNLIGTIDCDNVRTPSSSTATPNFITTNGMKWYGFRNSFTVDAPGYENIWVDVNGENTGSNTVGDDVLRIHIQKLGKILILDCPENKFLTDNADITCP